MLDHKYYCPGCGQEKLQDSARLTRKYSTETLSLPYFTCTTCRLIYADRQLVREIISELRNRKFDYQKISFRVLYREMIEELERTVGMYCRVASYKRAKFRKVIV